MRVALFLPLLAMLALGFDAASQADPPPSAPPAPEDAAGELIPKVESILLRNQFGFAFPDAPAVPSGPADEALVAAVDELLSALP